MERYFDVFRHLPGSASEVSLQIGRPWHFNLSYRERQVDFENESGIYIYSCPADPWDIPLHENTQDIWYVGKSDGGLAHRVWAHVGPIYDPGTNQACIPRFKYHQWADRANIADDVRSAVAHGEIVVYTIKVESFGSVPGIAQALEKFLLSCCFRIDGKLPLLNADL